jgi:Tfp pilus assembly protein PilP
MQRHESYQTKVYTYEPYEVPVSRNPFQRIVNSVYLEDEEKEIAEELGSEEAVRRFVQPELPPNSRFTGLISSGDNKLAILEIDDETYIVKENDIILDRYLVKSIMDEKVIIDINGYEISLQLGGGGATND